MINFMKEFKHEIWYTSFTDTYKNEYRIIKNKNQI